MIYWPLIKKLLPWILGAALGLMMGWYLWRPAPPKPETAAAAVKQADGSVAMKRQPMPSVKPPHMIPAGAKIEREMQVTVQPMNNPHSPALIPLKLRGTEGVMKGEK